MQFQFTNLGVLPQAELTLGDLTVICGKNNTGKTYITYAVYGFLYLWHRFDLSPPRRLVDNLFNERVVTLRADELGKVRKGMWRDFSATYSRTIADVFAGRAPLFQDTSITVSLAEPCPQSFFNPDSEELPVLHESMAVTRVADGAGLQFTLRPNPCSVEPRFWLPLSAAVGKALKPRLFANQLPETFMASAERTGSSIFQKELDFTRNRLVDLLKDKANESLSRKLLDHFSAEYPLPVRNNVDFIRDLPNVVKKESSLMKGNADLLRRFRKIIGGNYHVSGEGEIQFTPHRNRKIKLAMVESSSAVRSLLDLGVYLRHLAEPGQLLMIDEPELNLHPENQRLVARLLATLVNLGVKVFVTTHSDYIIRELNTLIALNKPDDERLHSLAKREGYAPDELLASDKVRIYVAKESSVQRAGDSRRKKRQTLVEVPVDPDTGISIGSFDSTIDDMNRIQDEILWGG